MSSYEIAWDRLGFPLIRSGDSGSYIGLFPVTIIQLERFVSENPSPYYDRDWYERLPNAKSRVSPADVCRDNVYRALATGVSVEDIRTFCEWLGNTGDLSFHIPAADEWQQYYGHFGNLRLDLRDFEAAEHPRIRRLLHNMLNAACQRADQSIPLCAADQMLMRNGIHEIVSMQDDYGKLGLPEVQQSGNALNSATRPEAQRLPHGSLTGGQIGFRLIGTPNS